jgi:hypothetical protein
MVVEAGKVPGSAPRRGEPGKRISDQECVEELSPSSELDHTKLYAIHKALDG